MTLSLVLIADVYTNYYPDHLSEPVCLCFSGDALHAQGLHHPLPPRAERTQTKTELQGDMAFTLMFSNPYISILADVKQKIFL